MIKGNDLKVVAIKRNEKDIISVRKNGIEYFHNSLFEKKYTIVEYIQSDGSQYIDTGVSGGTNAAYEIDFNKLTVFIGYEHYLGGDNPPMNIPKLFNYTTSTSQIVCETNSTNLNLGVRNNTRNVVTVNSDGSIYLNGSEKASTSSTIASKFKGKGWGDSTWWVFGHHGEPNLKSSMRLYSLRMYSDGTIIRDFIPVKRNADGVYGLWDKVYEKFYISESGVDFTGA